MIDKLMIVAHPDDEIVFGGAHLLRDRNWMVVCATNSGNRVRRREFETVMGRLGVTHEIWGFRDTYSLDFDLAGLEHDLAELIQRRPFRQIVTHGLTGEYGHPQHQAISRIVSRVVRHNLFAFAIGTSRLPQPVVQAKRRLLRLYASQTRTLRELCRDDQLDLYIEREHFVRVK